MRELAGPDVVRHWIERAASRDADKPYIVSADDEHILSYGELRAVTRRISAFLSQLGIGANDRVVLLANNSIEHLLVYLGTLAHGATICTVHVEINRNQLTNILAALRPRLAVFEEALKLDAALSAAATFALPLGSRDDHRGESLFAAVNRMEAANVAARGVRPGDGAVILYTSGTTARPKGVVLSFRELLSNTGPTAEAFGMTAQERIYDFRSFNWCSAQTLSALPTLERGATLILGSRFSRSRFFDHVRRYGATIAAGNPTTIRLLLDGVDTLSAQEVPTLRFVTSSSAPLSVEDWRRFEDRFGIRVSQAYGCSETGWIAAVPGEHRRIGTVGRPLAYHRLAIVSAAGEPLPQGQSGAIEIGGLGENPYCHLGDDGTVTVSDRGRLKTGDLGFLDEEGHLHITGRVKELIIRGGVNISLAEIDAALLQAPDVVDAASVGVPDEIYGEEVVAFVVLRPGSALKAAAIRSHCAAVLPVYKAPKEIMLCQALPRSERGKLDRKALVKLWQEWRRR
ncbi:MAG TPA: class I adenylate-forming enzyme family protein [Hyphomicrobiaceae bacterium]|nr:class I adenylate-forming enzyme family protein [Hyphomicrobiaceae bacterium]